MRRKEEKKMEGNALGARAGTSWNTKVLNSLSSILGSTQKNGAGAGRGSHGQLIEGQAFTSSLDNSSSSGSSESKGANGHLGDGEKTVVIGDGSNEDGDLCVLAIHVANELGERKRRAVDAGHKETLQNNLVKLGVCAAGKEAVKLRKRVKSRVVSRVTREQRQEAKKRSDGRHTLTRSLR